MSKGRQHGELGGGAVPMSGAHWNIRKETSRAFNTNSVRVSAIAMLRAILHSDRSNDMIVTGGENVYSGEANRPFTQHPAVLEAAGFGIP